MSIARAGNEKKNFDARPLQTLSLHLFHLSLRHCPHNSPATTSPPCSPQIPPPSTVCANPAATLTRLHSARRAAAQIPARPPKFPTAPPLVPSPSSSSKWSSIQCELKAAAQGEEEKSSAREEKRATAALFEMATRHRAWSYPTSPLTPSSGTR